MAVPAVWASKKCEYALRAVFELARRSGEHPHKIADIAEAQGIPQRFLEAILNQLRQDHIVESRRGAEGGYRLAVSPRTLTVGRVIRAIEGPISPVACTEGDAQCPYTGDCVFQPVWERARDAATAVFDGTTFQDLLEQEWRRIGRREWAYAI